MKKRRLKLVAAALSALLAATALSACDWSRSSGQATPPQISYPPNGVIEELTGLKADTVLFTVDGAEVVAEEYLFWLAQAVGQMEQYAIYFGQEGIDWEQKVSGMSMAEYCKKDAMETAKLYAQVRLHAWQEGCVLTQDDLDTLQDQIDEMIAQLGGREVYEQWLSESGLSPEGFQAINEVSLLYEKLVEKLYGEGGRYAPQESDIDEYIEENDLLSAKHILLMTVDPGRTDPETGEWVKLSEEEIAGKRQKAEDLLAQLRASDNPAALFDQLMTEHSEDTGLAVYPDGYIFSAGEMVTEFEDAVRALEVGEISDIVESEYGFHIILRQKPNSDLLWEEWSTDQMKALLEQWVTEAEVKTTPEYDSLDPRAYYEGLKARLQQENQKREGDDTSPGVG